MGRDTARRQRATRQRIVAALLLAIAGGCAQTKQARPVVSPTTKSPPLPAVAFEQAGITRAVPRNAYVRIQERPGRAARVFYSIPVLGDMFGNYADREVETLDFSKIFDAKAQAFLERLCPHCSRAPSAGGAEPPFRVEITLARSSYHREKRELQQTMTLRILGRLGTVVYGNLATASVQGDFTTDPTLADQAMDQAFQRLADGVAGDWPQINQNLAVNAQSIEQLEGVLLAKSRAIGNRNDEGATGRRFAVLIGVSRYASPDVASLEGSANDAIGLFHVLNALKNELRFSTDHVVLLVDQDATTQNVRETLSRWLLKSSTARDTVLVFFAGHGLYSEGTTAGEAKEKYFLPVDYDPARPFSTAIPMQEMIDYFERLSAENVVMVFDACNAGAAERDDRTDELHRFARVVAHNRVNAVIAAAKPNQTSWEIGKQGLFTRELRRALHGRADANGDGTVSLAEVARFVSSRVPEESTARGRPVQEPVWRTNHADRAEALGLAAFRGADAGEGGGAAPSVDGLQAP